MGKMDCARVVDIHLRSFQGFFLTFLGPSFISLLYCATIKDIGGVALVAEQRNKVCGFVTGTTQPFSFYKRLVKEHLFGFFWASLQGFLRNPAILPRLLRSFTMPGQPLPTEKCATLMSLAVDPDCQGIGIGKLLVLAFLDEAKKSGCFSVNLTTDAVNNDGINKFYERLGFSLYRSFLTPEKRLMNEYILKFD
jgi:ribosomal protein S18 acetylase RimI-like enzyme